MSDFTLVIANKNYSSWSMRAWLALKQSGLAFDEVVIPLHQDDTKAAIARFSPSGKVPVLQHDGRTIWDSLAIIEYLAELAPEAGLWPKKADARAFARSVSAEMHSGFQALRTNMPMNIRESMPGRGRAEGVAADIDRLTALWRDCRQRFGAGGPFLLGQPCAADAMFAPVVTRFVTYAVDLDPVCRAYSQAVLAWPAVDQWIKQARAEPWHIEQYGPA